MGSINARYSTFFMQQRYAKATNLKDDFNQNRLNAMPFVALLYRDGHF